MDRKRIFSTLRSRLPSFAIGCVVGAGILLAYIKREKLSKSHQD